MVNHIILIGRLTRDPEAQYTQSGIAVTRFSIAVDRPFKNQETGEKETDFIDVVAWRRTAEFVTQYLTKGRLVAVEGRLQIRNWVAQDGTKRRSAEVVAENVQGLDRSRDGGASMPGDDLAQQPGVPAAPNAPSGAGQNAAPRSGDDDLDPFADE